jgi:hypothetical protein
VTVGDAVKSEVFIFIVRAAMLIGTGVGLPVAGWMLNRAVVSIDTVSALSAQHTVQLDHISTTMRDHLDALTATVADHEARLRQVERGPQQRRPAAQQRRSDPEQRRPARPAVRLCDTRATFVACDMSHRTRVRKCSQAKSLKPLVGALGLEPRTR